MADSLHHFTLERSTNSDMSDATMLNASLSPNPPYRFDDGDIPPVGTSFYYRLTGYTALGLVIPYNIVSINSPTPNSGQCLLQRMWGGTTDIGSTVNQRIKIDSQGNIIVCGDHNYTVDYGKPPTPNPVPRIGGRDAFVAKWSPAGVCQWVHRFGYIDSDNGYGLAIDSSDNIIVTGAVLGNGLPAPADINFGFGVTHCFGGQDVFLAKFSPNGTNLFFKVFGGTGVDQGIAAAVDSSNNIYIGGTFGFFGSGIDFGGGVMNPVGQQDAFLAKFDPEGTFVWQKGFGGTGNDIVKDIAVTSSGVFLYGHFRGTSDFGAGPVSSSGTFLDVFIAKYSLADGSNTWVKTFTDVGSPSDQTAGRMSVNSSGAIFLTGNFSAEIDLGGGHTLAPPSIGPGFFLIKFASDGTFGWSTAYGAPDPPLAQDLAVNSAGDVYLAGEMTIGIDFGFGFLLGDGGNSLMLVKFNGSTGAPIWAKRVDSSCRARTVTWRAGYTYVAGDCGSFLPVSAGAQQVMRVDGTGNNSFWLKYVE